MDRKRQSFANSWCIFSLAVALAGATGCNSRSAGENAGAGPAADTAQSRVDVMCLGDRIDNPAEAFHYSSKYTDPSTSVNKHADITPQTIEMAIEDRSGLHKYHAARSDEAAWNGAVFGLRDVGITTMAARLDSLNGTSAIVSRGAEPMNGYSATKYSIDTTSASASDQRRFVTFFGDGSFDKGTAWMGEDGCAVKLVLDEGDSKTNDKVETRHYEMTRIKK